MKKSNIIVSILALALSFACKKNETTKEVEKIVEKTVVKTDTIRTYSNEYFDPSKGVLKFSFSHKVGAEAFVINKNYMDEHANTLKFNELRYWVSNIVLYKANGDSAVLPNTYYLIENRDTLKYYGTTAAGLKNSYSAPKKREDFSVGNIPVGEYTKVKFAVGVDPTYNNNFTLTAGELDINQMSAVGGWAWQTSYIFLRTKGVYLAGGADPLTDAKKFVAETGGNEQFRKITFNLPKAIKAAANHTSEINLKADLLELLGGSLPEVKDFAGTKPAGWAADPNLATYEKFINAGSADQMTILANNTSGSFFSISSVVE